MEAVRKAVPKRRKGHKIRDGRFNLINRRFQKGGDLL